MDRQNTDIQIPEDKQRQIRKYEELHEFKKRYVNKKGKTLKALKTLTDKLLKWRKNGKGFLNKKNQLFNYHEWHAAGWGALLMILYFRLEQGIFLVLFASGILKVWRDTHQKSNDMSYFYTEIGKNLHYYVLSGFIVAELFILTGDTPPKVSQGLIEFILTAVLGL